MFIFRIVGRQTLKLLQLFGRIYSFLVQIIGGLLKPPFRFRLTVESLEYIGYQSLLIIFLVSVALGIILSVQGYLIFGIFNARQYTGGLIIVIMVRELAPVFTGLMLTARVGSAMSAELASMKITEQLDALKTFGVNPFNYLLVPRILSTTLAAPILSLLSVFISFLAGYLVSIYVFDINSYLFMSYANTFFEFKDLISSCIKALIFGLLLGTVSCFFGYHARLDSKGVGIATTQSVVCSSVLILLSDAILSYIMF